MYNTSKKLILIFFFLLLDSILIADQESWPEPHVITSINYKYYFKMYPDSIDSYDDNKGYGIAFKRTHQLEDSLLWKVSGWYAFSVFISNDGNYLVRLGNWPDKPRLKIDLAIAFYNRGELIKSYSTSDIIKDSTKIRYSVSHYSYYNRYEFDAWYNKFKLVSVDDIIYTFDIKTGKIISQEKNNYFKRFINKHGFHHLIYFFISIPLILLFIYQFVKWIILKSYKN